MHRNAIAIGSYPRFAKQMIILTFLFLACHLAMPKTGVCSQQYDYMKSVLNSLCYIDEALQSTNKMNESEQTNKTEAEQIMIMMTSLTNSVNKIQIAIATMTPFMTNQNEYIKISSELLNRVYQLMKQSHQDGIEILERFANMSKEQFMSQQGTLIKALSQIAATVQANLRNLPLAFAGTTYAICDFDRADRGEAGYLLVTCQERKLLILELQKHFGTRIEGGPQQHQNAVEAGAASILQVLMERKGSDQ